MEAKMLKAHAGNRVTMDKKSTKGDPNMRRPLVQFTLLGIVIAMVMAVACSPAQTPTPAPTATETSVPPVPPTKPPTATPVPSTPTPKQQPELKLTSSAFGPGEMVPKKYTRYGGDISPPLEWSEPPEGTQSFALLVFSDPMPDGAGRWVQWILFNIPPETRALPEGITPDADGKLPDGSQHLENSWGELKYGGPKPQHFTTRRYYFQIYALDAMLDLAPASSGGTGDAWIGATRDKLLQAMEGHILAQGELMVKCKGE
jgi:Raf kinase inhibitor-like YbhB/YbcL family protein